MTRREAILLNTAVALPVETSRCANRKGVAITDHPLIIVSILPGWRSTSGSG
jgi:hypothetical protein